MPPPPPPPPPLPRRHRHSAATTLPPSPSPLPPPPARFRLPFIGKKKQRRLSDSSLTDTNEKGSIEKMSFIDKIARHLSPEVYHDKRGKATLYSSSSMTATKKPTTSNEAGYVWVNVIGESKKEVEAELGIIKSSASPSATPQPVYQPPVRSPQDSQRTDSSQFTNDSIPTVYRPPPSMSSASDSVDSLISSGAQPYVPDPPQDASERLKALRRGMAKHNLDYYIVPSVDAHGSEYVAASDKRREFISGFTGSTGDAIISKSAAYLVTDARYWHQAERELDPSLWTIVQVALPDGPKDWTEWLLGRVMGVRIGIDARMLSFEKSVIINETINSLDSKIVYPPQNLVDLIWKDKPLKSDAPVFKREIEYIGQGTRQKLEKIRNWIKEQRPSQPSYAIGPPPQAQKQVGTFISSLPCIAWVLNLHGQDVTSLFHAYLYVGLEQAVVFLNGDKVDDSVAGYLREVGVERRNYFDVWTFLRRREWGEGKILISPHISKAVALMLTHCRYTIAPPYVEYLMAVKSKGEIDGLTRQLFIAMLNGLRGTRGPIVNDDTLSLFCEVLDFPDDTITSRVKATLDAEVLLDFLLSLLREGTLSNCAVQDANRKARRLMFKLVSKTDIMPRSLFITDVEKDPQAIAVGGFGKVFKGKRGGKLVALKMLYHGHHDPGDSITKEFYTEALAWRSLSHQFILPLLGIHKEGPQLFFVSSFMTNGALHDWRRRHAPVCVNEIQRLLLEVAKGVRYIHSEGIVHGDLHPGNVLLDSEYHCQITDFGSTRHSEVTVTRSTKAIAYNYAAPELFGMCTTCCQFDCEGSHDGQDEQHRIKTMKTDVYAFGCVYYAIFFDTVPFHGKNDLNILRLFSKGVRPDRLEDPIMEDSIWDLIQKCWKSNPTERPTMKKIAKVLTRL